jgi:hypothetical protein
MIQDEYAKIQNTKKLVLNITSSFNCSNTFINLKRYNCALKSKIKARICKKK